MNMRTPFHKSVLAVLAIGAVVGGLAVANISSIVPKAQARQTAPVAKPISTISAENMTALRNLDESFANLAQYIEPSVVHVRSEGKGGTDLFGRRTGAVGGIGTGVIFRPDGWIITNDHVVNGFDKVTVVLEDGREFVGQVRRAEDSDIAVVKIDAKDLPAATFGDSNKVRPGEFAMAVGSPFGLENTVTVGHISALGRMNQIADPRADGGARFYPDLIQTDTPINQGNSGGPLVNIEGQVIGINSAIISSSGGSNGIGFSIPSNQARLLAETLIEKGKITRGALGLVPSNLKEYQKKEMKLDGGALVEDVPNTGPAAAAGVKKGDVIVRVGTIPINTQMDVRNSMLRYAPGQTIDLEVVRDGQHKTLKVTLTEPKKLQPNSPQEAPRSDDGGEPSPFEDMPNWDEFRKSFPKTDQQGNVPPVREGKAKLGVQIDALSAETRKLYDIPANTEGVVVTSVEDGSVAARLGIKKGFVIQQIGDKKIHSPQDVTDAMSGLKWGDRTRISFGQYNARTQFSQTTDVDLR